jgi:hypothetical protein
MVALIGSTSLSIERTWNESGSVSSRSFCLLFLTDKGFCPSKNGKYAMQKKCMYLLSK